MGVISLTYKQMDEIRKNKPFGKGKEGSCYYHKNGKDVIKLYHSFFKQNQLYFDNLEDSNIAFPKDIIFYDKTQLIIGYTMPYLKGIDIVNGFPLDLNINQLKYAYIKLKDLIKKYKEIYMDDLCLDNILYNNIENRFNLIDTSRWYPKNNGYLDNINDINWLFTTILIYGIDMRIIDKDKYFQELKNEYTYYGVEKVKRSNQISYQEMDINNMFIEMINYLIEKQSDIQGKKIKTIKDLYSK